MDKRPDSPMLVHIPNSGLGGRIKVKLISEPAKELTDPTNGVDMNQPYDIVALSSFSRWLTRTHLRKAAMMEHVAHEILCPSDTTSHLLSASNHSQTLAVASVFRN